MGRITGNVQCASDSRVGGGVVYYFLRSSAVKSKKLQLIVIVISLSEVRENCPIL